MMCTNRKFNSIISLSGTPAPEEAAPVEPEAPAGAPKKGLKLSYDEYKQMANLMVLYMRKQEEEAEGEYRKVPKFSEARNFAVIHLKFKQRGQT